jgi:pimeloyl-ACP methyl ester carboxylesterase
MPYVKRNDANLYYEKSGQGPALVLLHALPFDHTLYLYQIAHFSSCLTVLALDFRGFGRSTSPEAPYGLGDLCDDVLAICQAEHMTQAIVLGTSIGSKAATLLGLDHPDFCRAVIAVGGGNQPSDHFESHIQGYRAGRETFHAQHLTSVLSPTFAQSSLGQYVIQTMLDRAAQLDMQGAGMARTVQAAHDRDLRPRLPNLRPPLLVLNGEFDNSLVRGTETASLVPKSTHHILKGCGHACSIEDPKTFNRHVLHFLDQHGLCP